MTVLIGSSLTLLAVLLVGAREKLMCSLGFALVRHRLFDQHHMVDGVQVWWVHHERCQPVGHCLALVLLGCFLQWFVVRLVLLWLGLLVGKIV